MFICKPCLDKHFDNSSFFTSNGNCEYCNQPASCYDIPSKYLIEKVKVLPETRLPYLTEVKIVGTDKKLTIAGSTETNNQIGKYLYRFTDENYALYRSNFEVINQCRVKVDGKYYGVDSDGTYYGVDSDGTSLKTLYENKDQAYIFPNKDEALRLATWYPFDTFEIIKLN